ncbi:hypothetical protein JCM16303_000622 [Sporobolomyces ruberrimus]
MSNSVPDAEYRLTSSLLPNLFAWVEIDGQPAHVYAPEELERKAIGYIEAVEGKGCAVRWADLRTLRPDDPYSMRTCGSGVISVKKYEYSSSDPTASWRHHKVSGMRRGDMERPLCFGKLSTTDDDDAACSDERVIKDLGSIRCVYRRISGIRESYRKPRRERTNEVETKPIHEKNKKARLSHQATFGEAKAVRPHSTSSYNEVDTMEHPLQVFEFRYRSRQLLQLEGHLPDSPRASPRSSPEIITLDDETERKERIARLRRELDALTGEDDGGKAGPSGSKRVKSEGGEERDTKKVKQEKTLSNAGKGKEKEVLVLSDSD